MGLFKKISEALDAAETKLARKLFGDEGEDLAREIEQASKDNEGKK